MLLFLSRSGALPLGKMGDRLQVHRTSVTNIVDRLERSGYVARAARARPADRRSPASPPRAAAWRRRPRGS